MRKSYFCICENKDADQLRNNCTADLRLCFRYVDSTIPLLPKSEIDFKPLTIFCGCTARFVLDLFGNPEDRFYHNEAQMEVFCCLFWRFTNQFRVCCPLLEPFYCLYYV